MSVYYISEKGDLKQLSVEEIYELVDIFSEKRPYDALITLENKWIADNTSCDSIKTQVLKMQILQGEENTE